MAKTTLTNKYVRGLPFTKKGQEVFRDSTVGFLLMVGKRTKTYRWQTELNRLGARKPMGGKIGAAEEWDCEAARKEALTQIADARRGNVQARPGSATLGDAWTSYERVLSKKVDAGNRSAKTLRSYSDCIERLLSAWLDTSLRDLSEDPEGVAKRHREIALVNGPGIADQAMVVLKVVYKHACKTRMEKGLPADLPTDAVEWHPKQRRDTGMAQEDLAAWYKQLRALTNPIRREFHMMMLLSGSRPDAMRQAKVEHLGKTLFIPKPKGHRTTNSKAYHIPLSEPMLDCIERVRQEGNKRHPRQAKTWLFPADSTEGCITDTEEKRDRLGKWGGDLRQTYVNATKAVGLDGYTARRLLNHAVADVHDGYATTAAQMDLLLEAQEKISKWLVAGLDM